MKIPLKRQEIKFCAFILSHGRADTVKTVRTLRRSGYTGDIKIVCDNEDTTIDKYRSAFGEDEVIVFNKQLEYDRIDTFYNRAPRGVILYARNACFYLAKRYGYTHFVELDDDYSEFEYRWIRNKDMTRLAVRNLDDLFGAMVDLLEDTKAKVISFSQGGDFIGGINGDIFHRIKRKAMNSFFCATERPFDFIGAINEDVNMYTLAGQRGELVFMTMRANLVQGETQQNKGGMSDVYADSGTFTKSMYSVLCSPSCVKINVMAGGTKSHKNHWRIHHVVNWNCCAAKVISSRWRKE